MPSRWQRYSPASSPASRRNWRMVSWRNPLEVSTARARSYTRPTPCGGGAGGGRGAARGGGGLGGGDGLELAGGGAKLLGGGEGGRAGGGVGGDEARPRPQGGGVVFRLPPQGVEVSRGRGLAGDVGEQ